MNGIKKYPGQPDNEIWFYDKNMPYYELTNFYPSPIKSKLPIQFFRKPTKMLDKNGKIAEGQKYFYHDDFRIWNGIKDNTVKSHENEGKEFEWKTAEHLFQASKFTDWWNDPNNYSGLDGIEGNGIFAGMNRFANIIEEIARTDSPAEARNKANSEGVGKLLTRGDWIREHFFCDECGDLPKTVLVTNCPACVPMRIRVMKWVVREKFTQNPELKELLWKTGDKKLVEHSPTDNFWGDGGDGSGQNWLGKILMETREKIIEEKGGKYVPTEKPEIPEPTIPPNSDSSETPPLEETNNPKSPPTDNNLPPNRDDNNQNNDPGSPSKNTPPPSPQNESNTPTLPSINKKAVVEAKNIPEAQQVARQQIQLLFQKSSVKPSDLEKSLWKGYDSWENFLSSLKKRNEITDFLEKMEQAIKTKSNNASQFSNPKKPSPKSIFPLVLIVVPAFVFFLVGIGFIIQRKKLTSNTFQKKKARKK